MKRGCDTRAPQDVDRGVEALDVADLEDGPAAAAARDQVVGLGEGGRHRLLDQDVLARVEQRAGHAMVVARSAPPPDSASTSREQVRGDASNTRPPCRPATSAARRRSMS